MPGSFRWAAAGLTLACAACRVRRTSRCAAWQQTMRASASVVAHGALRGAREAPWSGRGRHWHHPAGVVSCGDAAGVADPLTGEGISVALLSGEQAGRAIARYLQDGCAIAHLEAYSGWVGEHFRAAYQPTPFRQIWARLAGG